MNYFEESLKLHEKYMGKISIKSKVKINSREDLSLAYSPGVAKPCLKIKENKDNVFKYTSKGNLVAVITDGSAVLGLGNIGVEASLPVMEGKAILFKEFGGVDAIPITVDSNDVDEFVNTVKLISKTFGGINLEDISAPRCFEIEERLKKEIDIPVFHDDQHGTAIVVLAALINSLKIVKKKIEEVKIVVNGMGAAGTAIAKLLKSAGAKHIVPCDKVGILNNNQNLVGHYKELAELFNKESLCGNLSDALVDADVFIGVSASNILKAEHIRKMKNDSIIFAMANPNPEIMPEEAKKGGARIIGTGRSDYPNQINNVSIFPGLFRGALDVKAKIINEEMKIAAAKALAEYIDEKELNGNYIIPSPLDKNIAKKIAEAVKRAAIETKVSRI